MKKILSALVLCVFFWSASVLSIHAADTSNAVQAEEKWTNFFLGKSDTAEIDRLIDELFPKSNLSFRKIVEMLVNEESTIPVNEILAFFTEKIFSAIHQNRTAVIFLVMMSLVSALFANFANAFHSRQAASIGFYVVYLLMITVCLRAFRLTLDGMETSIGNLLTFMQIFSPLYFISMAISVGSVSSIAFYNLVILLIYLVELIISRVLLPFVHVYLTMQILNFLSEDEVLSKFAEFIKMAVEWCLKVLFAGITGISLVQGLLSPAIDTVKRNAVTKGIEMIPGIGDIAGSTGEMLMGAAVLVKNGIGVAGALIVFAICLVPILNMAVVTLLYKGIAAFIQPLSEKRFTEAISSMGEGYYLLLKIEIATALLFLITIAVAVKVAS